MKMRLTLAAVVLGVGLWPAGAAMAQMPDVPGIGAAADEVDGGAPARPARNPAASLPGADALPVDTSQAPAATGSGSPTRLPATGVDTTALALDAVTLLGAGTLLLAIRRRLATS